MPAAIPLVSAGIGLVGSAIGKKKGGGGGATGGNPAIQAQSLAAMRGQGQLAGQAAGLGAPNIGAAANFYQTMLRGDRASMALATAGPRAAITDTYRGAARGLQRSGLRGAVRDMATADLARQQSSDVSKLVTGVQPAAADALNSLGQQAMGTASSAYGSLTGLGLEDRRIGLEGQKYSDQQSEKLWGNIGKLVTDGYGAWTNRNKGGGAAPGMVPGQMPS